jgi:hypothetical protein
MKRVTPSMVVSGIALFVALGGTGIAASNALIGSKQIADHSIRMIDLHSSVVKALKGKRGLRGPAGPAGVDGPQGRFSVRLTRGAWSAARFTRLLIS